MEAKIAYNESKNIDFIKDEVVNIAKRCVSKTMTDNYSKTEEGGDDYILSNQVLDHFKST